MLASASLLAGSRQLGPHYVAAAATCGVTEPSRMASHTPATPLLRPWSSTGIQGGGTGSKAATGTLQNVHFDHVVSPRTTSTLNCEVSARTPGSSTARVLVRLGTWVSLIISTTLHYCMLQKGL